jgi:hypothetical protein
MVPQQSAQLAAAEHEPMIKESGSIDMKVPWVNETDRDQGPPKL